MFVLPPAVAGPNNKCSGHDSENFIVCGVAEDLEMGAIMNKKSEVHEEECAAHRHHDLPPGITDQNEGGNSECKK
ncbi:hypothetical protein GCM10010038_35740 [Glutamicibacter protophormiae]|nr:hypothetical protein GCM10010038_35740 [Glutamicibacter protophormiae]